MDIVHNHYLFEERLYAIKYVMGLCYYLFLLGHTHRFLECS